MFITRLVDFLAKPARSSTAYSSSDGNSNRSYSSNIYACMDVLLLFSVICVVSFRLRRTCGYAVLKAQGHS